MKTRLCPKSKVGKWSVGLTTIFLLLIIVFFIFMALGFVTFDQGHWWDITVAIAALSEIIAFILGVIEIRKKNEGSLLIYISVIIGSCFILFILLHSLFIND